MCVKFSQRKWPTKAEVYFFKSPFRHTAVVLPLPWARRFLHGAHALEISFPTALPSFGSPLLDLRLCSAYLWPWNSPPHPDDRSSLQGLWVAFVPGLFWGWAIPLVCTVIMGQRGGYFEARGWSLILWAFQISTCESWSLIEIWILGTCEGARGAGLGPFGKPSITDSRKKHRRSEEFCWCGIYMYFVGS